MPGMSVYRGSPSSVGGAKFISFAKEISTSGASRSGAARPKAQHSVTRE